MKSRQSLSQNNLICLLKTLSESEWKDFEKFAGSAYFNKGRNYLTLLKQLKKFHPEFSSEDFTRENIYDKLYPSKQYKESVMKSMLSRLNDIAEEFIIQTSLNKNEGLIKERLFIKEISSRGLKSHAEKKIRETEAQISKKKTGLLDSLALRDYSNEIVNHHYNFNERKETVEKMMAYKRNIIYAFLTEILITKGSLYSQRNFWGKETTKDFIFGIIDDETIDKLLDSIKVNDPDNYVVLNLFNILRKSISTPDDDVLYYKLRDSFYEKFDMFDFDFKQFMMNSLSVLCSNKAIAGRPGFQREGFNIRKRIYEQNLHLFAGEKYMQISEFRTAFLEALNLNELEWAREFEDRYISKLQPDLRNDVKNYCKARLFYEKKDYENSLVYANMVNINQITFKMDLKNIVSKIYYNTNSTEPLISLLDSYYKLLENSKAQNKNLFERHFNYIKHLRKLVNLKINGADKSELHVLKRTIEKENVNSSKWLIGKIHQLV